MTLYVVSTPIGNLGDITLRAIDTLKLADIVVAEDTRHTRSLLSHLGLGGKTMRSLHDHSTDAEVQALASELLLGKTLAYVSDAGTPIVSDPGERLVEAAIAAGIEVVPVPGASAVLSALVGSGLSARSGFRFLGFLPRDGAARSEALARVIETPEIVILYESPKRTGDTLRDLAALRPEREVVIARELSKHFEEFVRGRLSDFVHDAREWMGEIVILLGHFELSERGAPSDADIVARIKALLAEGGHAKGVADRVAAWSGRARREMYELVVSLKAR